MYRRCPVAVQRGLYFDYGDILRIWNLAKLTMLVIGEREMRPAYLETNFLCSSSFTLN
jgi:hypothetical protein